MSGRSVALLVLLVALAACAACGAEDIELAARPTPDASPSEAAPSDAAPPESGAFADDGGLLTCDARSPTQACEALGATCGSDGDCCSTHCASGACVLPGACAGAGAVCTGRSDCCSGLCEPQDGTTVRVCLAACKPVGASCIQASDCCALGCTSGVCGGAECLREGATCSGNADCCSNECSTANGSKCVVDPVATCRSAGDDCHSGGPGTCCGVCDDTSDRCDVGPGPCRPLGAVCTSSTDCCHGAACTDDGTGRLLCTFGPLADGTSCVASFECGSTSCIGDPPVCGTQPATCAIAGSSCTTNAQCCSAACASGTCQSTSCVQPH